uniref:NADH-ubiquinone oxidoreductase chain 6 n=1 Tax=Salix viminalis TaxID=40686 RepID=A0A6N2K706_SALVM
MERKGKAVATTSAQNQGGHNGDGDDERKRKEADEAYRRLIRKAEKAIAELLHNLTKDDHFPSFPLPERVVERHKKVKPETRRAFVNGLCVDLSTSKRNSSHFLQFIDEMLKSLSEGRRTMILSVLSSPALVSGLMVARAKNPSFAILQGYLFVSLDFSAMIFPVVHIGAIAVSFLFVVMMFHIQIAEIHEEVLRYLPVSAIIGLIFWWEMFFILDNESIPLLPTQRKTTSLRYTVYAGKVRSWTNLETLGNLLYTYYFVWFLVPSLILLVAMIGAIVLTMHRTTKEDYNEEDDRPPHDLLKARERARSVLPIPVVVVSVKYTVPIVTVAVFPSVVRAKVRFSVPASKINSSVKLLQLELENLKNGPEKKETPSNGTGLDHRLAEVSHAGNFDRSSGGRVFELGTIPSDTVFEMRQEKSQFESLSLSYTLFAVEKWMGLLATVPGIHLSQTSTFRDPPSAILKEAAPNQALYRRNLWLRGNGCRLNRRPPTILSYIVEGPECRLDSKYSLKKKRNVPVANNLPETMSKHGPFRARDKNGRRENVRNLTTSLESRKPRKRGRRSRSRDLIDVIGIEVSKSIRKSGSLWPRASGKLKKIRFYPRSEILFLF